MAERIVKKQQLAVYVGTDAEIKRAISSGEITENDLSIVTDAPSIMDFNYVTTTTTEFDSCKQSAPHTAYIINLQNSTVYAYDNEEENWIAQADTPTAIIGAGRFSFNRITTKLFFCTGNEILHMSTATLDAGGVEG